ncbi:medium-chain fatty acid-CoA ligase faa2 [Coemansia sp. Benny D115]|nr:medium-chain fatty acid-CoA ligase faa2 [Coemansia sp. Benny D115]
MQSFKVPSSEEPGYTAIHRHPKFKDGTQNNEFKEITTLYELFKFLEHNQPKSEFLGTRPYFPETDTFGPYEWITTSEAADVVDEFGSGLDHLYAKYAPEVNDFTGQQPLGLYSVNRAEWLLAELSAIRSRRYTVGICDTVGVDCAEYIMNHSDLKVIVCSIDKIPRMLERMQHTPYIKVIVCMDKLDCSRPTPLTQAFSPETVDKLRAKAAALQVQLLDMDEVIKMGKANPTEAMPPKASDFYTTSYSSGTTGAQKGVLMTHNAVLNASRSCQLSMRRKDVTYLSFIPLVHCFDRYVIYSFFFERLRIGFYSGDLLKLTDDLKTLRPTVVVAVPRLLNRIYDRVAAATIGAKGIAGILSRMGYKSKVRRLNSGRGAKHALWDRLVFDKVSAIFGGRVELIVSGAASIEAEVLTFFRASLSCTVIQGYGQTEMFGGGTIQHLDDLTTGNVGVPNPGVDIRLRSIPEMGYLVSDAPSPRGELMVRTKATFSQYHKEPEKTAEVKDGEWLATGDVARINLDGTLSIIDRIKNIQKTANGFWVSPDHLENTYNAHPLVQTSFVHGDEHERDLVAIVVPNPETFIPWAARIAPNTTPLVASLCADDRVIDAMTQNLRLHGAASSLSPQEQIRAVHLEPSTFESVNPLFFTSTFKIRRNVVTKHYQQVFEALFAKLGNNDSASTKLTSTSSKLSL